MQSTSKKGMHAKVYSQFSFTTPCWYLFFCNAAVCVDACEEPNIFTLCRFEENPLKDEIIHCFPFWLFFSPLQGLTVVHPILPVSFPQQPNAQNNGLFVCQTQSASKEKSLWACNWHEGNYKRLAVVLTGILDCV